MANPFDISQLVALAPYDLIRNIRNLDRLIELGNNAPDQNSRQLLLQKVTENGQVFTALMRSSINSDKYQLSKLIQFCDSFKDFERAALNIILFDKSVLFSMLSSPKELVKFHERFPGNELAVDSYIPQEINTSNTGTKAPIFIFRP